MMVLSVVLGLLLTGTELQAPTQAVPQARPTLQTAEPDRIEDVIPRGNRRIPSETIKYNLQTKKGDLVNLDIIRSDMRRLYALGYFDNITPYEEDGKTGKIIIFDVKEKPTIRAIEYKGMIFAYMGPPELRPEFPIYDSFELPGYRLVPGGTTDERYTYDCNWLQLAENNGDVVHFVFLHYPENARTRLNEYRPSANPEASLEDYFEVGQGEWETELRSIVDDYRPRVLEWQESPIGVMSIHTRRVGEFVWVRLGDYMMPNVDQFAPTSTVPSSHGTR